MVWMKSMAGAEIHEVHVLYVSKNDKLNRNYNISYIWLKRKHDEDNFASGVTRLERLKGAKDKVKPPIRTSY